MTQLSIPQLAALDSRSYVAEIKVRLRDNEAWADLLDPVLMERTRAELTRIVSSIDAQKRRVAEEAVPDPQWLSRISVLRRLVSSRLEALAPVEPCVPTSKEARAWRAFSARLAGALKAGNLSALDTLKTPYGGMTARQWLVAREEKKTEQ